MRPIVAATIGLLAFAVQDPAFAKTDYEEGKGKWVEKQYPEARPPLIRHRATRGGRTAEVDYMLGTSGCQISQRLEWGRRLLNYILYSYPLTTKGRTLVKKEIQRCQTATLARLGPNPRLTDLIPGATASGKLFFAQNWNPVPAYPAHLTKPLSVEVLRARRVPLHEKERYQTQLARLAPSQSRQMVFGRFGIISTSNHSTIELQRLAEVLEDYMAFLGAEYNLEAPSEFLTIHLSPTISSLEANATRLHSLAISPSTLGYAYPLDLSVSAVSRRSQNGTVLHEMFHLLVRDQFGDVPQWLDEGVASLYEVSAIRDGRFVGLPNWRGTLLDVPENERPSLEEVIRSPWFDFDGVSGGDEVGEKGARDLALARYFALYLQERGKLPAVFRAFIERDPGGADDPADEAVRLVEQAVGPLSQAEPEFWTWFDSLPPGTE